MDQLNIDWNNVWKQMTELSHNQLSKREKRNFKEAKENAIRYLNGKGHGENMEELLQSLPLSPELRVLDIGPGPGNMVLPMSPRVEHITAVEPDDAMIAILREQITEHGITNITTVQKKWEDIDITKDLNDPYDLVIASQSLHMLDLKEAIKKMCAVSRKWIYLFWAAGISPGEQRWIDLWPKVYGRDYCTGPRSNILYNLLYDMKIYPNVTSESRWSIQLYPDKETAIQTIQKSFKDITTPEQENTIRDYYLAKLEKGEKGFFLRHCFIATTFWWDVSKKENENGYMKTT